MSGLAIRFKLRDLRDIEPWGEPNAKRLHWFGLSDGCYCIETAAGRLLEYEGPIDSGLGEPWCDYQVARLFEDILQCLSYICDPIPVDIINHFHSQRMIGASSILATEDDLWSICRNWFDNRISEATGAEVETLCDIQSAIWENRTVDFQYLRVNPQLHLWSVGTQVHLDWEALPPWLPPKARLTFAVEEIRHAVAEFCATFLADMGQRVTQVLRDGWPGNRCELDIPGLAREQTQRENDAATSLAATWATDWERVRGWLVELESPVQKS